MSNPRRPLTGCRGFTLLEAVLVIVITGILGAVVAVFIRAPIEGYMDSVRRAELTDAADTALRRIARDVRTALPNSLRGASSGCFEFLPTIGGGRYRVAPKSDGTGNTFNFTTANAFSFDVLADVGLSSLPTGTNHVVVYNLGIGGADAYNSDNERSISTVTGVSPSMTIALSAGNRFPFESPGKRFHVIPNFSVAYSCSGSNLIRTTQVISTTLAACPPISPLTTTVLVSGADCSSSSFSYTPAVSTRNGLLTITLVLTQSGESVRLYDEVHVNNVP